MELVSIRIITDDVARLVAFYEQATGATAIWGNEVFAELPTASGTLAVVDTRTVPLFGSGAAEPGANRSVVIEYLVDRRRRLVREIARPRRARGHRTHHDVPWGNRALLLRDPDGNLVNFFTPVTPQARAKFGR